VVILSARDSFFDQYRIRYAIRSYLTPRRGVYETKELELLHWDKTQGANLLRQYGLADPEEQLDLLLSKFGGSTELVLQPFFISRVAKLLRDGESFQGLSDESDDQGRIRFAVNALIRREHDEKWRSNDGHPLLTVQQHYVFLSAIAGEMWRSSAFQLDGEEMALICQLAGDDAGIDPTVVEQVMSRIQSHALIGTVDGRSTFVHEKFFEYFFAVFVERLIRSGDPADIIATLGAQELSIDAADWVIWIARITEKSLPDITQRILTLLGHTPESVIRGNAGLLVARSLPHIAGPVTVSGLRFVGDCLAGQDLRSVTFDACDFDHVDLSGTQMHDCLLSKCVLRGIGLDYENRLGLSICESQVESIEFAGDPIYDPATIDRILQQKGIIIAKGNMPEADRSVSEEIQKLVSRFCKFGPRGSEFSDEEVRERMGSQGSRLLKHASRVGVISQPRTRASRGNRRFYRFLIDRNELIRASAFRSAVPPIERFWSGLQ